MNPERNQKIAAGLWAAVLMLCLTLAGCSENGDAPAAEQTSAASPAHEGEAGRQGEGGHEEHGGEEGHSEEAVVDLSPAQIDEFGLELRTASPGTVALTRDLPGEVTLNPTRVAQVSPRVPGVVTEVRVVVGDHVREGRVMAVLASRELARAKSEYLAALSRLDLARADFQRVEKLWKLKIAPKAEYLAARQTLEAARLAVRLAGRELDTLGLTQAQVAHLPEQTETKLARYELTAPIAGEVVKRTITQGEVVPENPAEPPFVVADLSTVWVQLTVYPKDLAAIRPGQTVRITADQDLSTTGIIEYVSPIVGEGTRTATARVVLENIEGRWKPGLFVRARVRTDQVRGEVVIPKSALQTIEGETVVFAQTPEGFEPRPVELGRSNGKVAENISGLVPGQSYVAANAFVLKAELLKGTFGGHHH
ncbi:MAG: efflux RND transporter periplasmic adaptor subunit [Salinisphaera sp.]|nr:efflux RND transporter periplasmic adaptor subunit [Salinisphaera sp.]